MLTINADIAVTDETGNVDVLALMRVQHAEKRHTARVQTGQVTAPWAPAAQRFGADYVRRTSRTAAEAEERSRWTYLPGIDDELVEFR